MAPALRFAGLWFMAFLLPFAALSAERALPQQTGFVVDEANILRPQEERAIAQSLESLYREKKAQVQLLTVASLDGEPLESFSLRVAQAWRLGDKTRDDGVLLVVAVADRKVRIEVGQGLEGALTDVQAGRIIDHRITPRFRAGRYYEGIVSGLDGILALLGFELANVPKRRTLAGSGRSLFGEGRASGILGIFGSAAFVFLFWVVLLPIFISMAASMLGLRRGPRALYTPGSRRRNAAWGAAGWGSGFGGGGGFSGGGGFGGGGFGGGGGFSGGGASGSW